MPQAKFVLRDPSAKKEQSIILIFRYKKQRLFKSLDIKILPKYWNSKTQRIRKTNNYPNKDLVNNYLNEITTEIEQIYISLLTSRKEITNDILLKELAKRLSPNASKGSFFEFCDQLISKSRNRINPSSNRPLSPATIETYKGSKRVLMEYAKHIKNEFSFDDIDLDFYYDFVDFMQYEKQLSINTMGKHIKNLKAFLNEATEKGINNNLAYRSKRFTVLKEASESIYLTSKELDLLKDFDYSFDPKIEKVVDLFLIGAYTGLRVSDFKAIRRDYILRRPKGLVLKVDTQKTGETVYIPATPALVDILEKYEYNPPSFCDSYINKLIKVAGRLAGIKETVTISKNKGGRKISQKYFKYELIKTHTARRSFCTNAYLAGVDTLDIMAISGHKTESSFQKYIKVSKQQHADKMLSHPYFGQKKLKVI